MGTSPLVGLEEVLLEVIIGSVEFGCCFSQAFSNPVLAVFSCHGLSEVAGVTILCLQGMVLMVAVVW